LATNIPSKVAVLLGAGSSAPAGVPTTLEFVNRFSENLADRPDLRTNYDELLVKLRRAAASSKPKKLVDVEAVLESLETLRNPTIADRALAAPRAFTVSRRSERLSDIRTRLKEFIRTKCLVGSEKTEYLLPLIQLSNVYRPLPVFTVNYDVVVEQFLEGHGLSYIDGFELRFDSARLNAADVDVLLHKLHGSVTWFKSRTGGYLKLPIRSGLHDIELLSGEQAEPVMLYPAQKADYAGPFLELFRRFQETLRLSEWLLVFGYSFRDPILLDMVTDAAISNPKLKIVLTCGRHTESIFAENLAPTVSNVPDSRSQRGAVVRDRIVRFPYRVEYSFPDFLSTLFPGLQKATTAHATSIWAELHGEAPRWAEAAEEYLKVGVLAQGSTILGDHVTIDPLQQGQELKFSGLLALSHYANGDRNGGNTAWRRMVAEAELWCVRRVYPVVGLRPPYVSFNVNWHEFPGGTWGGLNYTGAGQFISEVTRVGSMLTRCLGDDRMGDYLRTRVARLKDLADYLMSQPQNGFALPSYLDRRSAHLPRWLRSLFRDLNKGGLDLSKEGDRLEKLRAGLGTAELRYVEERFIVPLRRVTDG
jgi:hypothetical protein